MSLLNRLLRNPPNQHYELTKRLVFEINEARKMGYSWKQIKWAAEGMLRESGAWREEWRQWDIKKDYKRIKKEGQA